MLRSFLLLVLFLSTASLVHAQEKASKKITIGIEQDLLPYATGGAFAGAWVGKDHFRIRALVAQVNKPDFIIQEGFTHNKVRAYAVVGDYFLKEGWKGWWAGTGLVYWKSSIQSKERISTVHYENVLLNGSLGYNLTLKGNFYLSPWAGMHLRVGGDKHFTVDGKDFTAPLLNPEASLKIGWFFN